MRHVRRVVGDLLTYSVVTRRVSLLVAFVVGLALIALAFVGKVAAPFVIYPFV